MQVQGPKHFETVDAEWRPQDVAPGRPDAAGRSSRLPICQDHERARGNPLCPGKVHRRPSRSARRRWKSAAACSPTTTPTPPKATTTWRPTSSPRGSTPRPSRCFEKALEIYRRLLTDEHPNTAQGYNNVAYNLQAQGKYAQAQPLFEKALEINRRLLTDDHPDTATSYNNVAYNLYAQGNYAAGPAALREGSGDPPPPAH